MGFPACAMVHVLIDACTVCHDHLSYGLDDSHNCPGHPAVHLNLDLGWPPAFTKLCSRAARPVGQAARGPGGDGVTLSKGFPFCWSHSKIPKSINNTENMVKYLSEKELRQLKSFLKLHESSSRFLTFLPLINVYQNMRW